MSNQTVEMCCGCRSVPTGRREEMLRDVVGRAGSGGPLGVASPKQIADKYGAQEYYRRYVHEPGPEITAQNGSRYKQAGKSKRLPYRSARYSREGPVLIKGADSGTENNQARRVGYGIAQPGAQGYLLSRHGNESSADAQQTSGQAHHETWYQGPPRAG